MIDIGDKVKCVQMDWTPSIYAGVQFPQVGCQYTILDMHPCDHCGAHVRLVELRNPPFFGVTETHGIVSLMRIIGTEITWPLPWFVKETDISIFKEMLKEEELA